jgi:hydroxypyruvate isomerase
VSTRLDRRSFVRTALAGAAGAAAWTFGSTAASASPLSSGATHAGRFRLNYAPHFGMFRQHAGQDLVAQLEFMAAEGFTALEDNGMPGKSVAEQERIAKAMDELGIEMGVFVAHADFQKVTFASTGKEEVARIESDMHRAVEVAKRVNAKWCTVVPGRYSERVEQDYQTANVVDNLRRAAEVCEPSGLVMVLESLNPWRDHPGLFLSKIPQAFEICRAVNSPSVKILDDLYHQQITEGNLIPNIDKAWSEIAYFQTGDNPGRKEPTTGEINYKNVFKHIHSKGFNGVIGMEHGNSRRGLEGEKAVIKAYQECDSF